MNIYTNMNVQTNTDIQTNMHIHMYMDIQTKGLAINQYREGGGGLQNG